MVKKSKEMPEAVAEPTEIVFTDSVSAMLPKPYLKKLIETTHKKFLGVVVPQQGVDWEEEWKGALKVAELAFVARINGDSMSKSMSVSISDLPNTQMFSVSSEGFARSGISENLGYPTDAKGHIKVIGEEDGTQTS